MSKSGKCKINLFLPKYKTKSKISSTIEFKHLFYFIKNFLKNIALLLLDLNLVNKLAIKR